VKRRELVATSESVVQSEMSGAYLNLKPEGGDKHGEGVGAKSEVKRKKKSYEGEKNRKTNRDREKS